jgi:putative ABC transport system permease protein
VASRFESDPNIAGRTMLFGCEQHVITGVISARFDFGDFGKPPEVWVPFKLDPNAVDQGHYFQAAGRLKEGMALQQA